MNKTTSVITGLVLTLAVTLTQAADISPQLQAAIDAAEPGDKLPVIINLVGDIDFAALEGLDRAQKRSKLVHDLKANAAKAQEPIIDALQAQGISNARSLWAINALATDLPVGAIKGLSNNPKIESIDLVRSFSLEAPPPGKGPNKDTVDTVVDTTTTDATEGAPGWNLNMINAPELWALSYKGNNTVIANMDTGVDVTHPDLELAYRGGDNSWYDPYGQHPDTPFDSNGHGTMTAGVSFGGNTSGTVIGTAPNAKWIAVKAFNDSGMADTASLHLSFQWLLDPDNDPNTNDMPDVVNNSWSMANIGSCDNEFADDINLLRAADIAVVFSAGNYGSNAGTSVSPGNNSGSFATGAVDDQYTVANFSSRGPSACDDSVYPEVGAPGVGVMTTSRMLGSAVATYSIVDGTSFAAPHVAGAIALLRSAFPDAKVSDIEQALTDSALDLGDSAADNNYGYGLIDVEAAYYVLASQTTPTDPPSEPPPTENTIIITVAEYNIDRDRLTVEASSDLGGDAQLNLDGYGSMSFRKGVWSKTVNKAGGDPGSVTVSGPEGSVLISTTAK